MSSTKDFVVAELMRLSLKRVMASSIAICCPFHQEKSPSFYVNIDETNRRVPIGFGHCFSETCPKKNASWNEIAEKLGLGKIAVRATDGTAVQERMYPLNKQLKTQLLGTGSISMEDIEREFDVLLSLPIDEDETWRSVPGKLLRKIGCTVAVDRFDNKCLIIPIIVEHEIVGAVKATWTKPTSKKVLSYTNLKGEWIKEKGLFPYDLVERMIRRRGLKYVVLVEGQRDALRLIRKGIPALAILGTGNWSVNKRNLVLSLPVDKVVVMMDADKAGISASNKIMKDLKGRITRQLVKLLEIQRQMEKKKGGPLDENLDPGNCPSHILKELAKSF